MNQNPKKILEELLALPKENECVEFKEAKNSYNFEKLGTYFSALSNEACLQNKHKAYFVLGVDDHHKMGQIRRIGGRRYAKWVLNSKN